MGMGLGQATGPQGNPALWGKERAACPGLMGLGKRETDHTALPCAQQVISTPPPMLAVHYLGHAPQKVERLRSQVSSRSSSR